MRKNEAAVGAALMAAILVLVLGTLWLKNAKWGSDEQMIEARFREVGQLLKGNDVKMRGVPIGRVEEIRIARSGDEVVVRMSVASDVRLPRDAVVVLSPESLFGDWQAEIFSRAQFPRYAYLEPRRKDVLPGYALPDISRLTAVADRIAENVAVLTERIGTAFTEETAVNIRDMVDNLQEVSSHLSDVLRTQEQTVEDVAANLQSATQSLGSAAETVGRTFGRLDAAISNGEVDQIVENARLASMQLDTLTKTLVGTSSELRRAVQSADSAFTPLQEVSTRLARGEGTLGKLAQDTTLYAELVRTNQQMQILLRDIQQNPRRYINLKVF